MYGPLMLLVLQTPAQAPRVDLFQPVPHARIRAVASARQQDDPILLWNEAMLQAIRVDRTPPPKASRNLAILHAAMYDAVNALTRSHTPYLTSAYAPPETSPQCAAALAAHRVLHALYPAQGRQFDELLDRMMVRERDGESKEDAVALGQLVAEKVLTWREPDNAARQVQYSGGSAPGEWRPTPPDYQAALLPQWGRLRPFTLRSPDQFRPARPPSLTSAEYTADYREVKELGGVDSRARTPEQTEIAHFWADGEGTVTPPGHWNRIAQSVSRQQGLSLEQNARLFALLNMAMADAAISCWECKYRFGVWRPVQAIREADRSGNPDMEPDPGWQPLLKTPPFPSYTSGHSTFSGTAASVLACYFGTDRMIFDSTSDGLPGVTRSFSSFWAAAREAGKSRIYGGIHYEFDNSQGLTIGRALGRYVCESFLQPRP